MSLLLQVRRCAHSPNEFSAMQINEKTGLPEYVAQLCETCNNVRKIMLQSALLDAKPKPRLDEILELTKYE